MENLYELDKNENDSLEKALKKYKSVKKTKLKKKVLASIDNFENLYTSKKTKDAINLILKARNFSNIMKHYTKEQQEIIIKFLKNHTKDEIVIALLSSVESVDDITFIKKEVLNKSFMEFLFLKLDFNNFDFKS